MYLTVHTVAGMSLGTFSPNAPLAFGLAILSHFILDRIPHDDPPIAYGTARDGVLKNPVFRRFVVAAAFDLVIATILAVGATLLLKQYNPAAIVAGALGGMLPDLLFGIYRLTGTKWLAAYNRFHDGAHFNPQRFPITFIAGFTIQIITLTIFLRLLFR